jgi:glucose-1-phosphate thymidylyltransferase
MKGIILAGGSGSRLAPLTMVTNKHLLPVYNKPMICYPIQTLVSAGITDIIIVTGGEYASDFIRLLEDGKDWGITKLQYAYQQGHGGIAHALKLAEDFVGDDSCCVVLGDNILEHDITPWAKTFNGGAKILLCEVSDPQRFGVAKIAQDGVQVTEIIEKPAEPPSNLAVIGIYFYDASVFGVCRNLKPSKRGELEITDVNNYFLRNGKLTYDVITGQWSDAGTFESLHRASAIIRSRDGNSP